MLQSIRDKTHGWIAGIIISILILSFALWGIHSYLAGAAETATIAKVNGVEITKSQLAVAYERLRRQLQIQYSSSYTLPEQAESALKGRALQTLVDIQVLRQASYNQGYRVSSQQVDNLLESLPEFQVNDRFSMARFQQVLSTTLFSAGDFLDLLQTSLLMDQPRIGILFTSFALPNEIANTVTLINQERKIQYASLSVQDFLKKPIVVPANEVEAYYQAHQNEFKTPEQISIDYLDLSVDSLKESIKPSEEELKNFYNENSNAFATPGGWQLDAVLLPVPANTTGNTLTDAENKINDIQQKINGGAQFSEFTHQYPADKLKLHGWVTLNQVPSELQKAVMSLTKKDQTTAPIRTSEGFVILKATDIKDAKIEPFDAVKDKVKDALVQQQAEEKFGDLKEKLANLTYEHPESLQSAASIMGLPIKSSVMFTKEKGNDDISSHNKIREAAFSPDVLSSQNNSDVIQLSPDNAIVLRIKTHVPATLLPLKTVENQIIDKLKTSEAEALALKQANEIIQRLSVGESAAAVAASYNLTWTDVGYIGRRSTKIDAAILDQAFAMPRPTANKMAFAPAKTPTGYAIIALEGVQDGSPTSNQEQLDVFGEQIQNTEGLLEYNLYKQSMTNQAKIVISNPQQDSSTFND